VRFPLSSLLLAALAACGGASKRPVAGPPDPRVAEIAQLSDELRYLEDADEVCAHREDICALADDLGDNAWAAEKCLSARRACRTAHQERAQASVRPPIF
jgi:hypothetical protein